MRIEEERPLRGRRILGEDGEETKIEYVKEKRPSRDGFRKFGGEAGGRERPSRDGAERRGALTTGRPVKEATVPHFVSGAKEARDVQASARDGKMVSRPISRPRRGGELRERRSFDGERSRAALGTGPNARLWRARRAACL